jgi:hypothetical protein
MPDADDAFVHAANELIGLYRGVERKMLDLPWLSIKPFLIFLWASIKFGFFFDVGILLIVPTNLVILIRNLFPGHWRYRPFFLRQLYYVILWLWRGEAPTAPIILVRPLLSVFTTAHFERRLRRLRHEIVVREDLSDATRSTLLARLDFALERWKTPRFAAVFFSVILPGLTAFPGWYKGSGDLLGSFGIEIPTDAAVNFLSQYMSTSSLQILGISTFGYLIAIPITSFLAKRGLFIGAAADRICFPGGQAGSGVYSKEREILGSVGIHTREAPIDLWLVGVSLGLSLIFLKVFVKDYLALVGKYQSFWNESNLLVWQVCNLALFVCLIVLVVIRRGRTGRA